MMASGLTFLGAKQAQPVAGRNVEAAPPDLTFSFEETASPTPARAAHLWRETNYLNKQSVKTSVSTGTEIARPFLPAKDFDLSKRFYEALGFAIVLDADVAIFGIGPTSFILQKHFQKEWAENFMMQLMVDDLDAWWTHLASLDLPTKFGVPAPKAPALQPWGLRIAYVVDPSGVLWHVAQRRAGAKDDE